MTYEILYTSAPAGLKPGSSGYCTVKGSRGIPGPTLDLLESLSGYRHVFTPGTPEAVHNPVNWGHYLLRISGRMEHVLSRVSDCETDYTGRSNKLAHHMVVDSTACPAGPAWLLSQRGWMTDRWDGQVEQLGAVRTPPPERRPPGKCVAWERMTGDAGWAGVIAEAFLADPERKVFAIYRPDMNILPLFEEALSLLPETRRWEVTFATHGAALPSTVDCLWSGIVAGSPEVQQSRRFVNALRINLTLPVPPADGGVLVDLARTGIVKKQPSVVPRSTARAPAPPTDLTDVEASMSPPRSPAGPRAHEASWEPEPPSLPTRDRGGSRVTWWILLASVVLLVSSVTGGAAFLVLNRTEPRPVADADDAAETNENGAKAVVADSSSKHEEGPTERTPLVASDDKSLRTADSSRSRTAEGVATEKSGNAQASGGAAGTGKTPPGSEPIPPPPMNADPQMPSGNGATPPVAIGKAGSEQPMSRSVADPQTAMRVITAVSKRSDKETTRFDVSPDQKISAAAASRFSLLLPRVRKSADGPLPYHELYRQRFVDGEIRVASKGALEVASAPIVTAAVKTSPLAVILTESSHRDSQLKACLNHGGVLLQDSTGREYTMLLLARSEHVTKSVPVSKDFVVRVPIPQDSNTKTLAGLLRSEDALLSDITLALDGTVLQLKSDADLNEFRWDVTDDPRSPIDSISISKTAEIKDGTLLIRIKCTPAFNTIWDPLDVDKSQLAMDHNAIVNHFKNFFPEPVFNSIKFNTALKDEDFQIAANAFRKEVAEGYNARDKKISEEMPANTSDLTKLRAERTEWLGKIDNYLTKVPGYRAQRVRADKFKANLQIVSGALSYRIWPLDRGEAGEDVAALPESKTHWDVPWWSFGLESR